VVFVSRLLQSTGASSVPGRDAGPDLLEAGGLRAGLVPGPPGHPRLGQGCGISQATAYRYKDEAVEVLAAKAPTLHEAWKRPLSRASVPDPGRHAHLIRPVRG